jgi:gliding motility-associated-like protein
MIGCAFSAHSQLLSLTCLEPSGCAPHGIIIEAVDNNGVSLPNAEWIITTPTGNTLQSVANPYVAIFNQPGNYDVAVIFNGQTTHFDDYISVFSKPQAAISTADGQGCLPFCTSLMDVSTPGSGIIVSRSWDFGDGTTSSDVNPVHCYDQIGTFTPVLAVEDENGCFASVIASQLITVNDNYPQASFMSAGQNSCSLPTSLLFDAQLSSDITSFSWSAQGVTLSAADTLLSLTAANSGDYSVCLTVENNIGCRDTACNSVIVSDTPIASFSLDNDTICSGQTVEFTNTSLPLPTETNWDFNGDSSIDGSQHTGSFAYSPPGTYAVTMTAHYGSTCSMTVVDTVVVRPNPTFNFTGNQLSSCVPPLTTTFTNNEAFNPAFQYFWLVNGEIVGNSHHLTYTFDDFGVYDLRLRRITDTGCDRARNKFDYVTIAGPEISFDYEEYYCVGEPVEVSNITMAGNEEIIDYMWDFNGDGEVDALGPEPDYVFETAGEFFAVLTATNADGCVSVDTSDTPLTVLEPQVPSFSSSLVESCAGETFGFCTEYNADNLYTWDFHDGTSPQEMLAIDSCITHIYEDTGYFDVTLTVFNGACNTYHTIEDYIHVVPPLALFEFEVICDNYSVEFHDMSIEGDSLIWDFGDETPFVINDNNPTHQYASPGQYTVTLTAYKEGSLCYDTKVLSVSVAMPSADLLLSPTVGCAPLTVAIDNENSNDYWDVTIENGDRITVQRNENPLASAWTIIHEHNGEATETTSNDPTTFDWPSLVFENGGTHDVHVAVVDEFGCEAETTYTDAIVVWPGGDFASIQSAVLNACDSGGVSISVRATNPSALNWSWSFSDGSTSDLQETEHHFSPPFDYNNGISCTLTATDGDGCTSSRIVSFDVVLPASPSFTWQAPPVCRHEEVLFTNNSLSPAGTLYSWNFGDETTTQQTDSVIHAYSQNGTYNACLTAINSVGCQTVYCNEDAIPVYSPVANATFATQLNTCLFAVQLVNTSSDDVAYAWWDFGDNQTGIGDTVLHTYPIGVFDVRLLVGADNGCTDTLVIQDILNYSSSVGPFSQLLDTANCAPFGVSFQAFNPDDQLFDYFWDFNDGNGDPVGGTTTSHAYTAPGSYCPSIMMTDPNGCDVYIPCTDTIVVEHYTSTAIVPEHICSTHEAVIPVMNADYFTWEHPWVEAGPSDGSLIVRADSTFDFTLTSRYSDCEFTQIIHVDVLPLPVVYLALIDSVCSHSGLVPLMGGVPEGGDYYYNNSLSEAINTDAFSGEFTSYYYSYIGPNGCSNGASDSVYVVALPSVEPLTEQHFCDGDSAVVFAPDSFSYFTGDGVEISAFLPHYSGTTTVITHHVYNAFGCYNSSSAEYMVNANPQGVIHTHAACAGDDLTMMLEANVPGSEINHVEWSIDNSLQGNGTAPQGVSYTTGGEHSISFVAESVLGCNAQFDTTFMVYDKPVAFFNSSVACEKDTTILTDLSTFGNDSITHWLWSYNDVELVSAGDTAVIFSNPGNTLVELEVTTEHGCVHNTSREIVVRYAPVITIHADDHCLGEPSIFESNSVIPSGGIVGTQWAIQGAPFTMQGAQAQMVFDSPGIYAYTFTANSNFGCVGTATDSLRVFALPQIILPEINYEFCENQQVGLAANVSVESPSSVSGLTWLLDGIPVSQENPANFELTDIGAFALEVEALSNHGCQSRTTLNEAVIVYPNPTGGFTWTIDQSTELPTVLVSASTSADVVNAAYNWGDGSSDEMETHQYDADGSFEITQVVTNSFGCSAYHSEVIDAYNGIQFYIPSAFTPDQNNYNESFFPVVSGSNVTYYAFRIFNRWGNEVFSSTIPGEGWDGTFHGEPVQDGAYNWSVDMIVRGRPDLFIKKGSVLLMR